MSWRKFRAFSAVLACSRAAGETANLTGKLEVPKNKHACYHFMLVTDTHSTRPPSVPAQRKTRLNHVRHELLIRPLDRIFHTLSADALNVHQVKIGPIPVPSALPCQLENRIQCQSSSCCSAPCLHTGTSSPVNILRV